MEGLDHQPGALVISLDLELIWGLRDLIPSDGGAFRQHLLGVRTSLPRLLDVFEEFGIGATWATVGALFASCREELAQYVPSVLPCYDDPCPGAFVFPPGHDEHDDPLHYGLSLIEMIRERPRHEIGLHTFSHYYCLEQGQTRATFQADLASAIAIARAHGVSPRSFVFPRHQVNLTYLDLLVDAGLTAYRGTEQAWMDQPAAEGSYRSWRRRLNRMVDTYADLSGDNVTPWAAVSEPNRLCNIPSSCFLRPYNRRLRRLEPLRFRRISDGLLAAARSNGIYHLWWHCYNFGVDTDENLAFLRRLLTVFADCHQRYGMQSWTMGQIAEMVRATNPTEMCVAATSDDCARGTAPAPVRERASRRLVDGQRQPRVAWGE